LPDTIDLGDGKVSERDETTWDYKGAVDWASVVWNSDLTIAEVMDQVMKHSKKLFETKK
jgi:hypothetical protein